MSKSQLTTILSHPASQALKGALDTPLYAVGGAVRDCYLGISSIDLDYSCSLPPDTITQQLQKVGFRIIPTGLAHQTVTVIISKDLPPVEITSFRNKNMNPSGGLHLGKSIEEDLSFRDFTCNALALCINTSEVIDPFNGICDIKKRVIRAVGKAETRFKEDPLRILRMLRFSTTLGFSIDPSTFDAAKDLTHLLEQTAIERIRDEFSKILCSPRPKKGLLLLEELSFFDKFIPELRKAVGFEQNSFHSKDVFEHTLDVVENVPQDLVERLSALFHDIGKPYTLSTDEKGERHFYLHEKIGADITSDILKRLSYSRSIIQAVNQLVGLHMRPIDAGDAGLRRIIRDTAEQYPQWRRLKQADTEAVLGRSEKLSKEFSVFDSRINDLLEKAKGHPFSNLLLDGNDLIGLGYKPSPQFKEILNSLSEMVIEDPALNTRDSLLSALKKLYPLKK